jgi:hypothetical protein
LVDATRGLIYVDGDAMPRISSSKDVSES